MARIYEEIYLLSHEKHRPYRLSSIQEAVGLLSDTLHLLRGNENYIRSEVANLSKSSVAHRVTWSKTAASIETLNGVKKPPASLRIIPICALNLLTYMTIDVKNIHSVVHDKDKLFTVLDHPRNFGNVAQGLTRTTHWAA